MTNTFGDDINCIQNDKFSNQDDTSTNAEVFSTKMDSTRSSHQRSNGSCRVCGFNKTTGRNFGVITCSTCKAFFRRNGRMGSTLPPCRFGGNCPVNERTRRQCPTCRLAKCFAVGMQKDLIRTDEERAARLALVRANRLQRHEKISQQQVTNSNEQNSLPTKSSMATLSSSDWVQLTNIRSAYEHFCLNPILRSEEEREDYLNSQPIKCRLKEHSFINALNTRLLSLASFFRATVPSFLISMNKHDREWLMRVNLYYLLPFSSMDLLNLCGNELYFDENRASHNVYLYIYGQDLLNREKHLIRKLNSFIGFDPIISKIMQIILFLTPCLLTDYLPEMSSYKPKLETILRINHSQEKYIDVLLVYLTSRYGALKANKLLMLIIGQVLQLQTYGADLDKKLSDTQPFGSLIHALLKTLSMD